MGNGEGGEGGEEGEGGDNGFDRKKGYGKNRGASSRLAEPLGRTLTHQVTIYYLFSIT